ncbi:MAG TPA: hypothetical protein VF668_20870 [Pyrinomonadaceae bacterium]|jgi:hypothetical protein
MNRRTKLLTCALALCLAAAAQGAAAAARQSDRPAAAAQTPASTSPAAQPGTPTAAARAFYTALREGRFREALTMSVYRPAVEGLSAEELEDLRPDFARLATLVPADFDFTGEQVSGDEATVFMKSGEERDVKVEPVYLLRGPGGAWIVGDRDSAAEVKKQGKKFFFEQRIAAHESEAEDMLKRIQAAQLAYALQNSGRYADLNTLVRAGYVPQDILGTETTGYRFTVSAAPDAKSYTARAEPARYGRSGRLSFYMDGSGIRKKDAGGKPLSSSK